MLSLYYLSENIFSREFTHRVKSVSMAKFTSQEVSALQEGGNKVMHVSLLSAGFSPSFHFFFPNHLLLRAYLCFSFSACKGSLPERVGSTAEFFPGQQVFTA